MNPRVVIAGAGLMGRWHAWAARRCGAEIVGVVDRDPMLASRLAASNSGASACPSGDDLEALVAGLQPDCVHICTPLGSHAELCRIALEGGAHVLVEKPLAATAAETREILSLAEDAERLALPVHQLAHQGWLAQVDRLGTLVYLSYDTCSAGADGPGGGVDLNRADDVVDDVLPHPLSLFDRIRPGCFEAATFAALRPRAGEFRAQSAVDGLAMSISVSMNGRPPRHELRITGTESTLVADLFHGYAWIESGSTERSFKIARPLLASARWGTAAVLNLAGRAVRREVAYPGLTTVVERFYAETRGDGSCEPTYPSGHAERVAIARDALMACARAGRDTE